MARGNARQDIDHDDDDREGLLSIGIYTTFL